MFTAAELGMLLGYFNDPRNPRRNLHSAKRVSRQKNKVKRRVLIHLNGMILHANVRQADIEGLQTGDLNSLPKPSSSASAVISGYVCGTNVEIEYSINHRGGVAITRARGMNISSARTYVTNLKKEILVTVSGGFHSFRVKRSKKMYYLQRWTKPSITPGALRAVQAQVLTQDFVKTMQKWQLRVLNPQ